MSYLGRQIEVKDSKNYADILYSNFYNANNGSINREYDGIHYIMCDNFRKMISLNSTGGKQHSLLRKDELGAFTKKDFVSVTKVDDDTIRIQGKDIDETIIINRMDPSLEAMRNNKSLLCKPKRLPGNVSHLP